jgi:hypothetical protein
VESSHIFAARCEAHENDFSSEKKMREKYVGSSFESVSIRFANASRTAFCFIRVSDDVTHCAQTRRGVHRPKHRAVRCRHLTVWTTCHDCTVDIHDSGVLVLLQGLADDLDQIGVCSGFRALDLRGSGPGTEYFWIVRMRKAKQTWGGRVGLLRVRKEPRRGHVRHAQPAFAPGVKAAWMNAPAVAAAAPAPSATAAVRATAPRPCHSSHRAASAIGGVGIANNGLADISSTF